MKNPDRLAAFRPISTHIAYNGRFHTSTLRFTDEQFAHLHIVGDGPVRIMAGGESHSVMGPAVVFCRPRVRHIITVPEHASAAMLCSAMLFDYGADNPQLQTLPACLHLPLAADADAAAASGMPSASVAHAPFSLAAQKAMVKAIFAAEIAPRLAAATANGRILSPLEPEHKPEHEPSPPAFSVPHPDTIPPRSTEFESACREVLHYLRQRLDFDLFMITRTEGDDWTVLQCDDRRYGVSPGTVFRWADSFCSHMVKGDGPRIAPNSDLIPAYATAAIGRQVHIKAYIGIPLLHGDGSLFGTLCAIHPSTRPAALAAEQSLLEMLAERLSRILPQELKAAAGCRRYPSGAT